MRRFPALWLVLLAILVSAGVLLMGPRRTQQPAVDREAAQRDSGGRAVDGSVPPGPAVPASALAHTADAPRQRDGKGRALPFRVGTFAPDAAAALQSAQVGDEVLLGLFPDVEEVTIIDGRWEEPDGVRIAGALRGSPGTDRFFMSWQAAGARGLLEIPSRNLAYEIVRLPGGGYEAREWLFTDIVCATPLPSGPSADRGIPRPRSVAARSVVARIAPGDVPLLNSRPGASSVIYLDFDGETVSGTQWAGGATIVAAPARMNASQVRETWERVTRDFENFTVNVTTDRAVHDAAPTTRRTHCIITATDTAAPGAGGVAYVNSFIESGAERKICWAFIDNDAKSSAEVISHEVGHTLGLSHDGRIASGGQPRDEYYEGHGSGPTGWAPIMGVGYYRELVQWSRGEYARANNPEDDLAIISSAAKAPYPPDDRGSTIATATAVTGDRADGVVEQNTDADFFSITLDAGGYTLTLQPSAFSNLKSELQVQRADGSVVATGSQSGALSATASFNLTNGATLYLRVRGTGEGAVGGTGFSNYGSLGSYNITGFGNQEQPPSAPIGLTASRVSGTQLLVSWTANPSATSYQIYRNGTLVGTVSGTEFLDTLVSPSTEYSYTVTALNTYGPSPASNPTVITSPAFDEFIMDGSPDFAGYLVSNPGMTIYAAVRGTKLFVATWSPGDNNSGFGSDHHLFVSDTLLPSATTPAPWAKRGLLAIPGTKPYLAGESTSTYAGWFNVGGARTLFKAPVNSGVMEGVIDLVAEFGALPANVYVAAVAYQTDDAGVNPPNSGKINAQAPAGNGNDNIEPAEFLRIPVKSVADARQNGIYDVLAPERAFRPVVAGLPGSAVVTWPAVPSRTYEIWSAANLGTSVWTNLTPAGLTAGAAQWEMSFTNGPVAPSDRRFFRVRVR